MRIDKHLKVSRLIKRRTVAKDIIDRGVIKINGRVAKPSHNVAVGDELDLVLGRHHLVVRVLKVEEVAKKATASEFYEIISDELLEIEE